MIRIRPGRSWRLNPTYVGELRRLKAPRTFTGTDILDVLGIEVDGVDIAAGVGEARVLLAVDELSQALLRLGDGEPAAQATIGPGPTELLLEARGADLLLTLVALEPPARVLASGLLVDAQKMRTATLHAARGLLLDLLAISPLVEEAPLVRRIGDACAGLARRAQVPPRRWPPRPARAKMLSCADPGKTVVLRVQLPPETMARLRGGLPLAPLASHLGSGALTLVRRGAPGLMWEGPVYLLLRNLLGEAEKLIEAWESGEPAFVLRLGQHELRWDLTADEVRAHGWRRAVHLPPLRFALHAATAAQLYSGQARRDDEAAAELRERAERLLQHCRDLETGDLRRAPATVAAPAPAAVPQPRQGPLGRGRMRRLVYREAWRAPAALRVHWFAEGPLVAEREGSISAHDAATGEALWSAAAAPGAAPRGMELFCAEPGDALVRVDVLSGEVRWKRRMRGAGHPARLWALPGGVLRSLPGEGLALVNDSGTLTFRAKLPGGAPKAVVAVERALLVGPGLAGLDAADGRVLWKRKLRVAELVACGGRALALGAGSLSCIDPGTGESVWEREVSQDARGLCIAGGHALLLAGGNVLSFSLAKGAARAPLPLSWAEFLSAEEEGPVIATGAGGQAMRLDGKRWSVRAEVDAPAVAAQTERGVVLIGQTLREASDGLELARLPPARAAALGPDLACALLGEEELAVHRLATHLSVL